MVENFLLVNESRFDVIAGSESEEFPTLSTDKIRRAGWLALNGAPDGRNVYYVLPGVFKAETIPGKEHVQAAKILHEEGVLWKKTKDRYTSLTPRINGQQYWTYALMLVPVVEGEESEAAPETDLI